MTRRKIVGAALFLTLFGAVAIMPPLVYLFRFDALVFGIPVETVYIFVLWTCLVAGAVLLSRHLPDDDPAPPAHKDGGS